MVDAIYTVEKECVICHNKFNVTKVRTRLVMIKQDSDFCTYYKEVNPYYYTIWVCPHCGYAARDTAFTELPSVLGEKVAAFLDGKDIRVDFSGQRTREQAIATYKLALYYADMIDVQPSKLAGMYLRLGWLYREGGQTDEEQLALSKAAEYYDLALSKERFPIDNLSEIGLSYLIGELFRRTGKIEQALLYLGKAVANNQAKMEPRIFKLAREAWHEARKAKEEGVVLSQ